MKTYGFITKLSIQSRLVVAAGISFVMLLSLPVHGQIQNKLKSHFQKPKQQKAWSIPITLERSSTLHQQGSYESQSYTSVSISPSYALSNRWTAVLSTSAYKEENSVGNSGWDNTSILLNNSSKFTNRLNSIVGFGAILPTDSHMRDSSSYQGSVRLNGTLRTLNLFYDSSLSYSAILNRNFHAYEQNNEGSFNIKQNITQVISYNQPLSSKFSLLTSLSYIYGWTYKDDTRSKFFFGADLSWLATPELSLYLGTSNEGNALKPNGSDSNIEFYNENSSIVKVGLTYVI